MSQRLKKTIKKLFFPMAILFMATSFTGAYFSDTVAVSGNTFETGSWGGDPPPSDTPGEVVISEVYYDNGSSDTGNEWIELYNNGDLPINLTGYDLYYGHYYTFSSYILSGKSFVLIHNNKVGADSLADLFTGTIGSGNMSDTSGSAVIFSGSTHSSATIVDFVEYGAGGQTWQPAAVIAGIWTAGDFVADVVAGHSIELNDKSIETNQSDGWHDQSPLTPGA